MEWKSLDIRDGAWKDSPPLDGEGDRGEAIPLPPPLPAHKKISGNCVFAKSESRVNNSIKSSEIRKQDLLS